MTAKKRTTKTTAPSSGQEEQAAEQPQVDHLGDFPLGEGHYFHPPVVSSLAHDGPPATLQAIQRIVGTAQSGEFDEGTASAVSQWKQAHGLDESPVIDKQAWEALRRS
jgi:peptidoglycan hydrolase-like protein with peptidoglycan-binding domain